jgi:hypothetical protein
MLLKLGVLERRVAAASRPCRPFIVRWRSWTANIAPAGPLGCTGLVLRRSALRSGCMKRDVWLKRGSDPVRPPSESISLARDHFGLGPRCDAVWWWPRFPRKSHASITFERTSLSKKIGQRLRRYTKISTSLPAVGNRLLLGDLLPTPLGFQRK